MSLLDNATEQEWNDSALAQSYPDGTVFGLLPKHYQDWLQRCYDGHCSIEYFDGSEWRDMNHVGLMGSWAYRKKPWSERDHEIATIKEKIAELNRRIEEIEEYEK